MQNLDLQMPPYVVASLHRWQGLASDEPPSLMQRRLQFLLKGPQFASALAVRNERQLVARAVFLQLLRHLLTQPTWHGLLFTGQFPDDDGPMPDIIHCSKFEYYSAIAADLLKDLYVISEEMNAWPDVGL